MGEVFSLPFVIPSTVIRTFAFGRRKRSPANKPAQFSSFKKRKRYPRWQTCISYQTCERTSTESGLHSQLNATTPTDYRKTAAYTIPHL